ITSLITPMRQKKKPFIFLLLALVSFVLLNCLIVFFSPALQLYIFHVQLSLLYFFFILLFVFLFSSGTYLFKNKKHGFLIAIFVTCFLLFRVNNLTHPFF